jgi:2-methylisocitrate lyase-like PEP mutase family enzyme
VNAEQVKKGQAFRDLHTGDGIFIMPNAWNAGSACLLEAAGFSAIGTTSGGIAFCLGLPDGLPDTAKVLARDAALDETRRIAAAVKVPVSVDAENGYGEAPEVVAETIRQCAEAGAVGASIEDFAKTGDMPLYDRVLAVERIRAAKEAAEATGSPFTLTARAECYLYKHPDAFRESVTRANLYREAGADCLYVPGVTDPGTIRVLVREINGPLNVVVGLVGEPLTVKQLEDLGVKRISIGACLARATFGLIRQAANEMREKGTFTFAAQQLPHFELARFFADRIP